LKLLHLHAEGHTDLFQSVPFLQQALHEQ
jgi:hypothetical protein